MGLSRGFELASDAQFREMSNFATPPRAGKITAIEGSGQVRVDCDDPEGGDVLAWPLNGFEYAVDDVVYVAFAVNHPESAIVIGSKGSVPTLGAEWDIGEDMAIRAERLEARDGEGLRIEDDGGNLGVFIEDGGEFGVGTATPTAQLHVRHGADPGGSVPTDYGQIVSGTAGANRSGWVDGNKVTYLNTIGASDYGEISTYDYGAADGFALILNGNGGKVGIGITAPQGIIHAHDGVAGFMKWSGTVAGSTATVIPNGTGDVTLRISIDALAFTSAGSPEVYDGTLAPTESANLYNFGGNTLVLTVNSDGSVTIARTAGSETFKVSLLLHWV